MKKTTSERKIRELNLDEVQAILKDKQVLVSPEDDRNPVVIAAGLGYVGLVEVERVETGFYDSPDQSRMINAGRIVEPVAFGQRVMQAVPIEMTSDEL